MPTFSNAKKNDGLEMVVVGQIRGAWGLQGMLKVAVLTDNPGRLSTGRQVYLEGCSITIEGSRVVKDGVLLKIGSIHDRTQASQLQGKFLTIPEKEVEALPAGSYYHFQLLDMEVWTEDDGYLGEIKEILSTGTNDVYVVRKGPNQKERLIPALKEVVIQVDTEGGRMEVRLPEGL